MISRLGYSNIAIARCGSDSFDKSYPEALRKNLSLINTASLMGRPAGNAAPRCLDRIRSNQELRDYLLENAPFDIDAHERAAEKIFFSAINDLVKDRKLSEDRIPYSEELAPVLNKYWHAFARNRRDLK